ncbi:SHIRT domain-containing protein [Parvimonas micra]|uniref:SHIRT domain-containing protein n=1 Tax=Parvimonas micra TaxID=33033 RepID=A0A9X3HG74_9FIRM|nr:SHIRT domain-containing protein [Parvimonas micra]MCZ7408127.1 SHIRT domain-containing protein [Parvimonas micra]MCZ7411317.1 SHIRT domain-containing protein [Parvimonas micra]MCZ7412904.1 SHIRT domain-containing protein [Parvimonas micra]WBB36948.1 SHIRT domain-containing protein [Parvimonas micra]
MKKKRISALFLVFTMLTATLSGALIGTSNIVNAENSKNSKYLIKDSELPEKEDDNDIISVPDYNLRKQICSLYGFYGKYKDFEHTELTKRDLRRIWYLSPEVCQAHDHTEYGVKVKSIEGLQYAENLTYLSLVNQLVSDLSPIANLTKLKTLKVKGTNVTDLAPLEKLVNLEEADLSGIHTKSTTPLKGLVKMKKLELICENLDFASNMKNLEILVADHSTVSDLTPLVNCKKLKELRIDGKVRDYISEEGSRIKDMSILANLQNLEFLSISNHQIEDISVVAEMRNLVTFHATDNKIKNFESLLLLPNLAEVWVQNNINHIELPTTNKYISAKKLFDAINKDELTKNDVSTIDEILNNETVKKFFSEDTLKKLAEYKENLSKNDKIRNKLFENSRLKDKLAKIVSVDKIPTITIKKGTNIKANLPALVKVKVAELKNKVTKGQFYKYTDGQEFKIAVVDKNGNLVKEDITFSVVINHGASKHSELTSKDGFITIKSKDFAMQFISYSLKYENDEVFEFTKFTPTKFMNFKVGGKLYEIEKLSQVEIEKALVMKLGEKAPEPTPAEKFDVTFKFVSADSSKELPQEVKNQLPKTEKIEKGQKVTLKAFNNVKVADGIWKFKGWNKTETTITSATEFVGTWEFVRDKTSKLGVFLEGNRFKVKYKVVDTEGNEIRTPNLLKIVKKNSSAFPENMILNDDGLYEFTNNGMLGNYELELNSKEYRLKDTYGFGIKYNQKENRGEFSYILKGVDKKPVDSTNDIDFIVVVEKVKEDNYTPDERVGLKTENGKQVLYFKVVNQNGKEVQEQRLLSAYGKDTALSLPLRLQKNGVYRIQLTGEDQELELQLAKSKYVLEDKISYYDSYNQKTFKGSLKYISKNSERFDVTDGNANNIPVKYFVLKVTDKTLKTNVNTKVENSSIRSFAENVTVNNFVNRIAEDTEKNIFERTLPVEWDLTNFKDEIGEYTLTGKFVLDGNTENPNNKTATIVVRVVDEMKADKQALQKAIDKAKNPETTKGKTEESVEAMNKALKKAEEILAKADATQEEVNKAEEELTASINALKDKPNPPKVELKNEDGSIVVTGDTNTLNKDWKVLTKGVNPSELVGKEYDAYDINLKDVNNGETQPRGEVTVTIKVKSKVEKLYHIDGGLKEIPFTYENGKITFKTNHFSVYAVVYGDKQNDNSKPGSNNNKSGKDVGKNKNSMKKNKLPRTNISSGLSYAITSILALGVAGAVGYKKKH